MSRSFSARITSNSYNHNSSCPCRFGCGCCVVVLWVPWVLWGSVVNLNDIGMINSVQFLKKHDLLPNHPQYSSLLLFFLSFHSLFALLLLLENKGCSSSPGT